VTPNDKVLDNNEPPQLLNGKTNPIYQPWIDAEASRISEADALDMIASKTKSADYVLTYNGNDFDMRVLRNRASVCKTDLVDFFEKQHIDIYADFIVDGKTRNFL
jgi:DNA polymerase elongation subunit (family B)